MQPGNAFLGLDLSTQSLTAMVIEPMGGRRVQQFSINFDNAYPSYQTLDGVLVSDNAKFVHVNPLMWVEAMGDMLQLLKDSGLAEKIASIGVSAQQHGSVYLKKEAESRLAGMNPSQRLNNALGDVFSRKSSPIWMDSSTYAESAEITAALGGNSNLARLTGSIATERFAGPQIRKFWKENPDDYEKTGHIALISSFATCLLIGRLAPVDAGDGFGTNLADIHTGHWSDKAMAATAPALKNRLPQLLVKDAMVGNVSPYLIARYGFQPETEIIVGSGDNPNSLVGLGLIGEPEIHAISLGTSDTYFGYTSELKDEQRSTGHIFGTADGRYMFLICFKNGSLAREQVKNSYGLTWDNFSKILMQTPPGNNGRILLPYFLPEITPLVLEPQVSRFGGLSSEDTRANVRAVAEAQVMAMYLHSGWTGRRPKSILVTAGGSENHGLLNVISQVFGTEARSFEVKESAALGAAIRAAHCYLNRKGQNITWKNLTDSYVNGKSADVFQALPAEVEIYHHKNGLLSVYEACEKFALGKGENPKEKIEAFKRQFPNR